MAKTLLQMLDVKQEPNKLSESGLIIIDAQREYLDGSVPLVGFDDAVKEIKVLLDRARQLGTKVWHVRHKTANGAPIFAPDSKYFQIVDELKPLDSENIIDKNHPSAFADTSLNDELKKAGLDKLIVTGFMTHACISASVRSAAALGKNCTVVASACATRDLPDIANQDNVIKARDLHAATLAALSDIFATVVTSKEAIKD